jgi:ABC-type branched-subunit amino acid transport system ATPase component
VLSRPVLTCAGIRKRFGGFVVLHDVSLEVGAAEILGVAGPNGAGKTTLFDILSGYVRQDDGTVELDGEDVTRAPAYARARAGLARTFQSPLVPAALTVGETLDAARLASSPKLGPEDAARGRALARLDVADNRSSALLDTLDRRKLLLACLLMRAPKLLMLDEPCSGLLREEIDEIDEVIRRIRDETGATIMVVEHRLELLTAIADRVAVLDEGRKIAEGPPAAVFDDPAVRVAYFEAPKRVA